KKLGQLLANPSRFSSTGQLAHEYMTLFMRVLQTPSTRKSHTNVLEHIRGYLKTALTSVQKKSLNEMIKRYHDGHIPLIAAVTLLKHYFEVFPDNYINQQVYFKPYPEKLLLMNNK
ncbi:MAG: YbgA family protein, partial [Pseudomonadales bacterium]|nr:YbgA family protein [Pseudomonadales bacterium]